MGSKYASGKHSISECDRCGFRYKLTELRKLIIKTKQVSIKVCKNCWEPDQPQLSLGLYPVNDPQAVREPRPDISYRQSGVLADGSTGEGSRVFQWGWAPVGGASSNDAGLTSNALTSPAAIGIITIT
jgi:hypothetical protein